LLVVDDVEDLAGEVAGLDCKSVAKAYSALLNLAEDDCAIAVPHFIQDRDAKRSLSVSRLNWEAVENIDESWALVPAADGRVDGIDDISACEARNRDPVEVAFSIAALAEEG